MIQRFSPIEECTRVNEGDAKINKSKENNKRKPGQKDSFDGCFFNKVRNAVNVFVKNIKFHVFFNNHHVFK